MGGALITMGCMLNEQNGLNVLKKSPIFILNSFVTTMTYNNKKEIKEEEKIE